MAYVKRERKLPTFAHGTNLNQPPGGHFMGTRKFATPDLTRAAYQIDSQWSDATIRFKVRPGSIDNKTCLCYSADKKNQIFRDRLEPKTRDWPNDNPPYGQPLSGGEVQMLSEYGDVTQIEVWRNGGWEIEPFN